MDIEGADSSATAGGRQRFESNGNKDISRPGGLDDAGNM
jgi:hypothetical protein